MSDEHRVTLSIEDGFIRARMECGYDAADESRPCWPNDLDGVKERAPNDDCVYEGWVDNMAVSDWHDGYVEVTFRVERVSWVSEAPSFVLGETT